MLIHFGNEIYWNKDRVNEFQLVSFPKREQKDVDGDEQVSRTSLINLE
jgi:hypothetical protein